MQILILGGTAFLGREVARQAIAAGHGVVCLARGNEPTASGARLIRADRDQPAALSAVTRTEAGTPWDAVIDVARQPGQVQRAAEQIESKHFIFVSTANVYASQALPVGDETAPLLPPLDNDVMESMADYGPAKVACEQRLRAARADRPWAVVRAGLIGGPGDRSGRADWWPWRLAHPATDDGRVLVPDALDLATSLIDVRDLASWLVLIAEQRTSGAFDAYGEVMTLAEHLSVAAQGRPHRLVAADQDWLLEQGVDQWSGPGALPLWVRDPDWAGFGARTSAAAIAAGLRRRPIAETLRVPDTRPEGIGLDDALERRLLDRLAGDPTMAE